MGTILTIKSADFSNNGMPLLQVDYITPIKIALESNYVEHQRYTGATARTPSTASTNRNAVKWINASTAQLHPFKVVCKTGAKIVPLQCNSELTTSIISFQWLNTYYEYKNFNSYPSIGMNVAYSSDADIPDNTSLWDFIDVELIDET